MSCDLMIISKTALLHTLDDYYNKFCIYSGLECLIVCSNMQLMSVQIFLPDSMKVKKGDNYPYLCQLLT